MKCEDCGKPVLPVVALDVDGVLSDYHGNFLRFAYRWLYREWHNDVDYQGDEDLASCLGITKETYRQIKLAYRQGGQKRFQREIGNVRYLTRAINELGFDLWITTTRPYNKFDNTDPDTISWLKYHEVDFRGLIYDDDKYKILRSIVGQERIVMVVDDLKVNCIKARDLGLPTYQFLNNYNGRDHWDGPGFNRYSHIVKHLEAL